jgi:hypothetical protein
MNPASAMGTFVRIWRSEWAGLSRAQLALAVSSQLSPRQAVTMKVIRRWEEGQPPNSTEELESLCKVMRRNALSQPEVEQFRKAVFAACLDRQYPELFGGESLAQRRDVDERARDLFERQWAHGDQPGLVSLVAAAMDLEVATGDGPAAGVSPGQVQKQYVALVYLRGAVAHHHGWHARPTHDERVSRQNAAFVQARFGQGVLDRRLSALALQANAALARAGGAASQLQRGVAARAVLRIADEALAKGEDWVGLEAFFDTLCYGDAFTEDEYRALRLRGARLLRSKAITDDPTWWVPHHCMFTASLWADALADAQEHLDVLQVLPVDGAPVAVVRHADAAALAEAHGALTERHRHLTQALAVARASGFQGWEARLTHDLSDQPGK